MSRLIGFFVLSCLTTLFAMTSNGQEKKRDLYEPGDRAQSFHVEAGGPGFFSLNYDFRFQKIRNGWGMRAGVGAVSYDQDVVLTLPVQINYLFGKDGQYFEVGGGASYVRNVDRNEYSIYDDSGNWIGSRKGKETENRIMGSFTFGYRKQPVDGGFIFRAGLSPIIYDKDFIPYLPYISFGYSF